MLRENYIRNKNIKLIFYIIFGIEAVYLILNLHQYFLLQDFSNGVTVADSTVDMNDLMQQVIAGIRLLFTIIAAVFFIMWFRRAYFNLTTKVKVDYDEGWAAGAWFVPFMNLVRPYKIMNELFEKTYQFLFNHKIVDKKAPHPIVGWWWGIWLGTNILENIESRIYLRAEDVDALSQATFLGIIVNLTNFIAIILAIKVVQDYHILENKFFKLVKHQIENPISEEEE